MGGGQAWGADSWLDKPFSERRTALERQLAAIEGADFGLSFASGLAAEDALLRGVLRPGDEILLGNDAYGGTYRLISKILVPWGVTVRVADLSDPSAVEQALSETTPKLVWVETPSNPLLRVTDIAALARSAHEVGALLVVDNTFATPALQRPLALGADVVVHSATKYIGGHGTGIGGAIVDGATFDWANGNFPEFTEPHAGYHGLKLAEALGPVAFIAKARVEGLRDLGPALSPFNAHGFIQGLETLHLRVRRHAENALTVARWLQSDTRVAWVRYPGLEDDPGHATARRYLSGGFGGLLTFGVKGDIDTGRAVVDGLQLFSHVANIGDVRSLVIHPASTTHQQLSEAQQAETGVTPDLLRLSIGLEHPEDLIADLDHALSAVAS